LSAYTGAQTIWMKAFNGAMSSWASKGTYTVTQNPPSVTGVTPSSGSGFSQTFQFNYTYPDTATDMSNVQVQFNTGSDPYWYCFAVIDSGGGIYLPDDNGNALPPVQAGQAGVVGNSRCSINGAASSLTSSATTWTLNLATNFTSLYAGTRNIYSLAM